MATALEQIKDIADKVTQLPEKLPDLATGIVKGMTTDLVGTPVDVINEALGVFGLKSEKPKYGSKHLREALFGSAAVSDKNIVETVGTLVNPSGAVAAGKAMMVGAIPKLLKEGRSSFGAVTTIGELNTAAMMDNKEEMVNLFKKHDIFMGHEGQAKSFLSDAGSKVRHGAFEPVMSIEHGGEIIFTVNDSKGPKNITEVFSHPKLFEMYPQLKDIRVFSKSGGPGSASFGIDDIGPFIKLSPESDPQLFRSKILHELQHAVQEIEHFKPGGSPTLSPAFSDPNYRDKMLELKNKVPETSPEWPKVKEMLDAFNADVARAHKEYMAIPGEKEARMTEATKDFSEKNLKNFILYHIETLGNQQFWNK